MLFSLARATGDLRRSAAHNQREAANVENSTNAPLATTCAAMRIKLEKERRESAQAVFKFDLVRAGDAISCSLHD